MAAVLLSFVLIWFMDAVFQAPAHVSLLLCATMFSAWFGGVGPGLLALGLSSLGFAHDVLTTTGPPGGDLAQLPRVVLFVLSGLFVTSLTTAQHSAAAALRRTRDDLQERSLELARTNAALRDEDTERQRAEYLMSQVFESVPDGVAVIDGDYTYLRVNAAYESYFGKSPGELVGVSLRDLVEPVAFEVTQRCVDRCLTGEEVRNAGWWIRDPLDRCYMAVTYTPLRPRGDRVEAALVVSRDLTEHILASEALRETEAALAQVTRVATLGEVTASLAHELNQPLAAIVNNANACLALLDGGRDGADPDEMRLALADVAGDAERASAIIDRVRAMAKRSPPAPVPLSLTDVVRDVVALVTPELRARRVALRSEVSDLPVVLGDRVQLQQVLLNLVVNGMDAMSTVEAAERALDISGQVEVRDGSPVATIRVRDRGVGLHSGNADRLFEAFFTTKAHGMGLGLAISRTIIESHGGRLWAESNRGPGATFAFSLPAAQPAEPA
ncbi:MAG TPA: ATP-binding protein [Candidatus Binatia bacterium]|nr:ATP-binding protein [Candidatus Binatia bacterium]